MMTSRVISFERAYRSREGAPPKGGVEVDLRSNDDVEADLVVADLGDARFVEQRRARHLLRRFVIFVRSGTRRSAAVSTCSFAR
jgi:hypothetical protein